MKRHVCYAEVSHRDHARLARLAWELQMPVAGVVRAAVNDYLESLGEPPLEVSPRPLALRAPHEAAP